MQDVAVTVKLRSMSQAAPAHLTVDAGGTARVMLDDPQVGIAPGQAAVVYQGERLLGGGWIAATGIKALGGYIEPAKSERAVSAAE
jgi:tRNA-specific 2-thiouridylase